MKTITTDTMIITVMMTIIHTITILIVGVSTTAMSITAHIVIRESAFITITTIALIATGEVILRGDMFPTMIIMDGVLESTIFGILFGILRAEDITIITTILITAITIPVIGITIGEAIATTDTSQLAQKWLV